MSLNANVLMSLAQTSNISMVDAKTSIVVTRPRAQLLPLLERLDRGLNEKGLQARLFALPLLEIESVYAKQQVNILANDLAQADLIVFVSPNAIRVTHQLLQSIGEGWPCDKTFAVVGGGSEEAFFDLGLNPKMIIKPANPKDWDSNGLWTELNKQINDWVGRRVVIVRGVGGRHDLIDRLTQAQANLVVHEIYRRTQLSPDDPFWLSLKSALIEPQALQASWLWLLTSSEAVRGILPGLKYLDLPASILERAHAICSHPTIAKAAKDAGFGDVLECLAGDEQMVDATCSWLSSKSK